MPKDLHLRLDETSYDQLADAGRARGLVPAAMARALVLTGLQRLDRARGGTWNADTAEGAQGGAGKGETP